MSSVSTKQRPSRRARSRPTEDLPAPMKPTRITLSPMCPPSLSPHPVARLPHGAGGGGPAIGAVAHPAAPALGEVVVDPRVGADADQPADALARRHEGRLVQPHADGIARAQAEEHR